MQAPVTIHADVYGGGVLASDRIPFVSTRYARVGGRVATCAMSCRMSCITFKPLDQSRSLFFSHIGAFAKLGRCVSPSGSVWTGCPLCRSWFSDSGSREIAERSSRGKAILSEGSQHATLSCCVLAARLRPIKEAMNEALAEHYGSRLIRHNKPFSS